MDGIVVECRLRRDQFTRSFAYFKHSDCIFHILSLPLNVGDHLLVSLLDMICITDAVTPTLTPNMNGIDKKSSLLAQ